jgi:stress response protein SCP2
MVKGANVGLGGLGDGEVDSVVVSLGWVSPTGEGDADVSVLLLGENQKVRSDADFYFYNNACAPDGSVQLLGKTPVGEGSEDRISFDLTAIPRDVVTILIAASRYESARFDELEDLRLTLNDASGEPLLRYAIDDAGGVSALIFGELYRRGDEWKFRAVGQGYEAGFAALATAHGVDIEDDAADDAAVPEHSLTLADTEQPEPTAAAAVPAPRKPADEAAPAKKAARPRTSKKKVTLPKARKKSLAENESWKGARLFPVAALKSDRDREMRATSVLLAVMAQVPEFGRRLTAGFGAPAGRMETFTEVSLPHGDSPRRRTASSGWSARASCGRRSSRPRPTATR